MGIETRLRPSADSNLRQKGLLEKVAIVNAELRIRKIMKVVVSF